MFLGIDTVTACLQLKLKSYHLSVYHYFPTEKNLQILNHTVIFTGENPEQKYHIIYLNSILH